jgi:transposase
LARFEGRVTTRRLPCVAPLPLAKASPVFMMGWTAPDGIAVPRWCVATSLGEPSVEHPTRVFIDTSKNLFQLHGVDAAEKVVVRRRLRRPEMLAYFTKLRPTAIGLEACGGAHFWARELSKLGHTVQLLPPQYVKAYVKRNKNDGRDAEAGCEAMSRPTMRFVPIKSEARQAVQMLAGVRERLVRDRTRLTNEIRGYAMEFGLTAPKGLDHVAPLLAQVARTPSVPQMALTLFAELGDELTALEARIDQAETQLMAWHRQDETSRRLTAIPGVGWVGAVLLSVKAIEPQAFRSGRDFAAWMGLTPKDHSTAGKSRLGVITRAGDEALRAVLVSGATSMIQQVAAGRASRPSPWLVELLKRKACKEAAVALANRNARIAWKLMVSGQAYDPNFSDQAIA